MHRYAGLGWAGPGRAGTPDPDEPDSRATPDHTEARPCHSVSVRSTSVSQTASVCLSLSLCLSTVNNSQLEQSPNDKYRSATL